MILGLLLWAAAATLAQDLRYFIVSENGETTHVEPERIERRNWSKGQISTLARPDWRPLAPGLDAGNVMLWRSDTTGARLYLLRFSSEKFRFKAVGKPGGGRVIDEWIKSEGCLAGINAGYFYLKPGGRAKIPLGLTIKDGKRFAPYRKNYSGCFYVTSEGPGFSFNTPPPPAATDVIQSFPTLIADGEIPEHLKIEDPKRLHIHVRRPRAGIGRDASGTIYFLASARGLSFFELAFLAGVLGLRDCLTLDGGSSVQMSALTRPPFRLAGRDPVPIGIGACLKK